MQTSNKVTTNRNHKDTLFRFIFAGNKECALSLYNAINGSNYTNADDLDFTTLDDVIYLKMKNDVSFIIDRCLNLYEHQSSYNPNMPFRGFLYFADLYRQRIEDERIYSSTLIKVPTPRYIVFYNGDRNTEDVVKLHLSDAFLYPDESKEFEWTATVLNINLGHNQHILDSCPALLQYSQFIQRIKDNRFNFKTLEEAIDEAVDYCIKHEILHDILKKQKKAVKDMTLTEFDEKKYEKVIYEDGLNAGLEKGREEGRLEGRKEGLEEGLEEGRINVLISLVEDGLIPFEIAVERSGLTATQLQQKMRFYY